VTALTEQRMTSSHPRLHDRRVSIIWTGDLNRAKIARMTIEELSLRISAIEHRLDVDYELENESYTELESVRIQESAANSAIKLMLFETLMHLGVSATQIEESFQIRRRWSLSHLLEQAEEVDPAISAELDQREISDVYEGGEIPAIPFPPR